MTVLIAGGGLAGAAAACLLGSGATLIERESSAHDKICGEFLSWETQEALRLLGVDPVALGAAPIDAVRLVHGDRVARAVLPGRGLGLSRRVLDAAVLERAEARGAVVHRGRAVKRLVAHGMEVEGMGRLEADRVLLATGKHDLRGVRREGSPESLVGFKMFYRLAPEQAEAVAGHVEVVLFPGGYAGLQPVEDGRANLCLLIRREAFEEAGSTWDGVFTYLIRTSAHLALRLRDAAPQLARPESIFRVPYGFVHAPAGAELPGVFRLGDQMGVIPSFSGDGMAIALHTAFAVVGESDAGVYHRRMRRDLSGQIGRAMTLHRLGQSQPRLVAAAARVWPGALAWIARHTRVPAGRLAWR